MVGWKVDKQGLENLAIYAIALISMLIEYPYVINRVIPVIPYQLMVPTFLLLLVFYLAFVKGRTRQFPAVVSSILVIQAIVWAIYIVFHNDFSYFTRIVYTFFTWALMTALYGCKGGLERFLRIYNYIILVMAVCGMATFFLEFIFKYPPLYTTSNIDGRDLYFFGLSFTNGYKGEGIIRYSGLFDEPGSMAFWGIFALVTNKVIFDDKKYERLLIISLIFTFSMAYYIQLFLYIVFFMVKKPRAFVGLAFVILAVGFAIYQTKDTDYELLYDLTFARFEFDESTGTLSGNNRQKLSETAKEYFMESPAIGIGNKTMSTLNYMSDNPYEILAKDGIVGMVITYLPLIVMLFVGLKYRPILWASLILAAGYLQRPFHINSSHYIVLYMVCIVFYNHHLRNRSFEGKSINYNVRTA